jgi:hypothetical protein
VLHFNSLTKSGQYRFFTNPHVQNFLLISAEVSPKQQLENTVPSEETSEPTATAHSDITKNLIKVSAAVALQPTHFTILYNQSAS